MLGLPRQVAVLSSIIAMLVVPAVAPARPAGGGVLAHSAAVTQKQALTKAINKGIGDSGSDTGALVVDMTTGKTLFAYKSRTGFLPASVEKLYTTSTALLKFGPNAKLMTRVFGVGWLGSKGTWHGTLFLKGEGDPTFGSSSFDDATYGGAGATIERLIQNLLAKTPIKAVQGGIDADGSYFDALRGTPATGYAPNYYVEGVLDGVAFDRGWLDCCGNVFQLHPTLYAAQQFEAALQSAGVKIDKGTTVSVQATPSTATQMAAVRSPTMATLIRLTNTPSDQFVAEMLLKDIGARFGARGSTAAGAVVVRSEVAQQFGIDPRLNDGSGLSYYDSSTPQEVVTLLEKMYSNQYFFNSLAISGETGTLQGNPGTIARGRCRGKTGTLAEVATVVGYCQALDGHTLVFAFLTNDNPNTDYLHVVAQANMLEAVARFDGTL